MRHDAPRLVETSLTTRGIVTADISPHQIDLGRPVPDILQLLPVGPRGADGANGRQVELRRGLTHIEWRLVGDTAWQPLVAIGDIEAANSSINGGHF